MPSVLVTGGSRGLGLGIARKLGLAGYCVIAIARQEGAEFAGAVEEVGRTRRGSLHFRPFDLSAVSHIRELIKELRKEFGPIYGLINNAARGTSGLLAVMRDQEIERLVQLNLVSPLILTKYVIRSMLPDGGGRIVNIASIVGFTGFSGLAAYAATKASLLGFTRSLAREVGQLGITVNAIAPGFLDTAMTQDLTDRDRERIAGRSALRRLAEIEDVANGVDFLMSDKAKNITGTVLVIDAGSTA